MKRILIAAGLVLAPATAFAQAADTTDDMMYGPQQGDWEATLSGTGTSNDEFDNHTLGLSGSVGQYLTNNVLLGVRQSVNFADVAGGDDTWNGATRGFADYVFDFGRWRPFLGVSLGAIYGDGVNDTLAAGPELGVKYYADRNTFIFAQTEYQILAEDFDDFDDAFDNGAFQHAVGVGFNF